MCADMDTRGDILIVGMDKITDKSCYLYDAFTSRGIRCVLYSRDKTNLFPDVKDRLRTTIRLVPKNLFIEILYFLYLLISCKPRHVEMYSTHIVSQFCYALICWICRVPLVIVCIGELYDWEDHRVARKIVDRFSYRIATLLVLTELYMPETVRKYRLATSNKTVFCHNRIPVTANCTPDRKEKIILFLNSFKPWRRIELILDAVPHIIQKIPEAKVLLVGATRNLNYLKSTHAYEEMLLKKIDTMNLGSHVETLPFTAHPREYYERASVFMLPADLVFCNFSVLEAMERCVPCVIADAEGASMIVENGVSGFIAKQDPSSFAQAVITLLSDESLRKQMGLKARERIIQEFNIEESINYLLDSYKNHIRSWRR